MPRRKQKDRDKALADLICARWWIADDARSDRITKWDESYRDHDPSYIDRQSVTRPPFIKYPYLDRVSITQTTMVMDATDAGGRWCWAQHLSPDEESRRRGESATEYLEWTYRSPSETVWRTNRAAAERVAQMGLRYGDAAFYVHWNRERVRWESVSPYDRWPDPQFGEWEVVLRTVTLARLFDIAEGISAPEFEETVDPETGEVVPVQLPPRDNGRAIKTVKRVEKAIRAGLRQKDPIYRAATSTDLDRRYDLGRIQGDTYLDPESRLKPEDDPFNQKVVIMEYYETHPDGIIAKVIPGFGPDENLILQAETNPYGLCPIVSFRPRPVDNEQYGIGNGEAAGGPAKGIDYNFRGSLAAIAGQAWPALLNTRRSNLRKNWMGSIYGLVIDVDDVSRDLGYLQPTLGPAFHQVGMQIAQSGADIATGEGARDPSKVAAAGSATQGAILESYASITDRAILRQWKQTMEQLAHVTLAIAAVHVTESQLIPVLGKRTPAFVEMRPEWFEGPWYVNFGGTTRAATQQLASHLNIAQAYGQSGELDLRESLREAYRLAGERDPERFLTRKDEPPPVEPKREHLMILDGQMPVVSSKEDLLRHWQEHQVVLGNWTRAFGPNDPRVLRLVVHLQATQFAIQQQQAVMGGQAQGAQPFQPSQAGAAGQPMSYLPAVENINGQRQASNAAAGGQAPGPSGSVPGRQMGQLVTGGTAPR